MRRWLPRILGMIVACGAAAGCKQQMFLSKDCFDQANMNLPAADIENNFELGITPVLPAVKSPPTVGDPDRPARHLTLREALATALENGAASDINGNTLTGASNDFLPTFATGAAFNSQSDRVKALALNPAVSGANLEASLSRFDAQWVTAMTWGTVDNIQQGLASFTNGNTGSLSSSIVKGLPSGGVVAASFTNNYRQLAGIVPNAISPLYESRLDFGVEQPLWRDYGADINQIIARFPSFNGTSASAAAASYNNRQNAGNTLGVGTEGILISRIRVEQQRAEFERRIQNLMLNVETSYWRLYQAYGRLYTFEEVFRIAQKSWETNYQKYVAGTIGPAIYRPIEGQYNEFRGERTLALTAVLDAERNLRGLMGIPGEDGERLVPIDAPTLAPYQPNWDASVQMALMQKPEISLARENLRAAQFTLVSQKNFLKPDLRFIARYSPVGYGTRLDGNGSLIDGAGITRTNNALNSLSAGDFADWNLGLTLSMPLGFRMEYAAVRSARLQLAQAYYVLQDTEQRLMRLLQKDYAALSNWYTLIEQRRAERMSYAASVEARYREFTVGKATVADFLLDAQRRLATAQVKEYEAIAEYNIALASFEHKKGNILKHNNVVIAEGSLPVCAEERAVEHEKERAKAFILRERPAPVQTPGLFLAAPVQDLPAKIEVPSEIPAAVTSSYSPMATPANPSGATAPASSNGQDHATVEPVNGLPAFRSVPTGAATAPAIQVRPTANSLPSSGAETAPTNTVPALRAAPRTN